MKIVWLRDARNDLEDIYRFLAQSSERTAVATHNRVYDEAGRLAAQPKLGKVEPLLGDGAAEYRSLVMKRNYKIVYRADDRFVYIIAVWDCRRDPAKLHESVLRLEK